MGLFDKVGSFLKRESADVEEAIDRVKERIDDELSEREAELEMSPAEKLRALQRQGRATDQKMDRIADKVEQKATGSDADAEASAVDESDADDAAALDESDADDAEAPALDEADAGEAEPPTPPAVTQIVLPDGSVYSGGASVDDDDDELEAVTEPERVAEPPHAGDLAWLAPQPGEEAVVPAFNAASPDDSAAQVLSEHEAALDSSPEPDPAPEASSTYEKTPAQLKYEEARAAADALLAELRGELREDGEL